MNPDLLLRVEVIFSDGRVEIGTGYPIWKGRILTARHVVSGQGGKEKESVRVVWRNLGSEGNRPSAEVKNIWVPSENKVDLAVLSCDFPAEVVGPFGTISSLLPTSDEKWSSHGFALVGEECDKRPSVPLKGTCFQPSGGSDCHFELDVDANTTLDRGWRGVSGAPVFVGGMIKGVIVECPEGFGNARLRATGVAALCTDKEFCDAVGFSDIGEYKKSAERHLMKLLENKESICIELADKFNINRKNNNIVSYIFQAILQKSTKEILEIFEYICKLWDRKNWPNDISVQFICELVFIILPCSVDSGIVRSLSAQNIKNWKPNPVGIHTEHMAEIAMASYDKRAVQVETVLGAGPVVFRPKHAIPTPPTEGLHFDVGVAVDNITKHMIDEYSPGLESNSDIRIKVVNKRLEQLSKSAESKYITFLYDLGKEDPVVLRLMSQLKQKFEKLFVVPRSADDAVVLNEGTIPSSIKYFLELAARTK
ncbi:hypothetical protein [Niveispirillum sp. BGYR6]|uniref:hypothetical protein n=1 Tax=Niveispirillum sp. BGYR6 TaxID=2971249 RepID=UPI0022B969DF|nr:hypothetical protein [Niveispirillum sp. BGYR6]MDG5493317.1 hypothetical protein [Niveispirillum sp. BGYR6]